MTLTLQLKIGSIVLRPDLKVAFSSTNSLFCFQLLKNDALYDYAGVDDEADAV
ncbi:hypothetical protein DPMN_057342 [Dreissena polymorpha]|uniref:Uncharacterized protein n=1 Tax=Dreissena polymorpha TaxID=45954 RepID=A0A9D4BZT8_DREPO|nr:hypothetical protein DPMN_057342 [Dreissena polymorpha]